MNIKEAMQKLIDGNKRYIAQKSIYPNQTLEHRSEILSGQKPFVVIIGCSDSRVPPEIIFDQGLDDLFVIRVAGNIIDDVVLGSVEYAIQHLDVKLTVVLGHTKCSAVTATVEGGECEDHTASLIKAIQPAVEQARKQPGDLLNNAIKANIQIVVEQLRSSNPVLAGLVKEGELEIIGAIYDLKSGKVDFNIDLL
jgi:carbonic anhydrase